MAALPVGGGRTAVPGRRERAGLRAGEEVEGPAGTEGRGRGGRARCWAGLGLGTAAGGRGPGGRRATEPVRNTCPQGDSDSESSVAVQPEQDAVRKKQLENQKELLEM